MSATSKYNQLFAGPEFKRKSPNLVSEDPGLRLKFTHNKHSEDPEDKLLTKLLLKSHWEDQEFKLKLQQIELPEKVLFEDLELK